MGAHHALCLHCARALRKVGYFGCMFPDSQGGRSNYYGGVLAHRARAGHLFLTILHPCQFLSPLTKQSAPKNAGLMWPFLILSPSIGDPREGRGEPVRRQGGTPEKAVSLTFCVVEFSKFRLMQRAL